MPAPNEYTQMARLREETEAPFAKLRLFVWPALFTGAGVATYFGATGVLAEAVGARAAVEGTLSGLGIDVAALLTIGLLWRSDLNSQQMRLRRISAGARLAALRVRLPETDMMSSLSDLRASSSGGGMRVVIICAEAEALNASLQSAAGIASSLVSAELLVVPLVISAQAGATTVDAPMYDGSVSAVIAAPLSLNMWQDVVCAELETALKQDPEIRARGFTLILKKNGRVGTRRLGLPDWGSLANDVASRELAGLDTANI